eukprot:scaffold81426_cov62-Phaeocystis_antarctica.AAC.1
MARSTSRPALREAPLIAERDGGGARTVFAVPQLRLPRAASRSAPDVPAETARDVREPRARSRRSEGCLEGAAACSGCEAGGRLCVPTAADEAHPESREE